MRSRPEMNENMTPISLPVQAEGSSLAYCTNTRGSSCAARGRYHSRLSSCHFGSDPGLCVCRFDGCRHRHRTDFGSLSLGCGKTRRHSEQGCRRSRPTGSREQGRRAAAKRVCGAAACSRRQQGHSLPAGKSGQRRRDTQWRRCRGPAASSSGLTLRRVSRSTMPLRICEAADSTHAVDRG